MAQKILDGTLSKQQYEYKKNYPGQGGDIYFNTYQVYERTVDQPGVIDQGTLNTYLLIKKGNDWYKGAELGVDGKWKSLTQKESGILVPNSDRTKPGTFEPIPNSSDANILGDVIIRDLNAGGTNSLRYKAINNAKYQLKKAGGLTTQQVDKEFDISKNIKPPGSSGTSGLFGPPIAADQPTPTTTSPTLTKEQQEEAKKTFEKGFGIRSKYDDVKYPQDLQLDHQDCIKFSIFNYTARGLSLERNVGRRRLQGKQSIGTITLPIPSGISDSNQVDWQKDDLDMATSGFADVVINAVGGGAAAGAAAASRNVNTVLDASGRKSLEAIIAVQTAKAALGSGANLLGREFGGVLNPNTELLFSGPQLRTFSFTFRMYPRSSGEAKSVQKIIRYFKQAMAVQRGESILILKTPNTFGIEYLTSSKKEHPYLNKFKECALTQCNVNYTPDGTYMTYAGDASMTAYELQLQFQELEPIFNDDYGNEDTNIGY